MSEFSGEPPSCLKIPGVVSRFPKRGHLARRVNPHASHGGIIGGLSQLDMTDELAVIRGDERQVMEEMIMQAMAQHGMRLPELSAKARGKEVARRR